MFIYFLSSDQAGNMHLASKYLFTSALNLFCVGGPHSDLTGHVIVCLVALRGQQTIDNRSILVYFNDRSAI